MTRAHTGPANIGQVSVSSTVTQSESVPVSNDEASERLVLEHLGLVRRLCMRFTSSGELWEDLVQTGTVGLLKAIKKYDRQRGVPFRAFAIPVILGEIKNFLRDHGSTLKIPRRQQNQALVVNRAVDQLTGQLGRSPTIREIADKSGLSSEEIYDTFNLKTYRRPLSLDMAASHNGNSPEEGPSLQERIGSEDPRLEQATDRMDIAAAMRCLSGREKAVLHLRFYGDLSQTKIANRLGISQMHVSRLQRAALEKLKANMGNNQSNGATRSGSW